MNIPEISAYLSRARRDLWAVLEGVPDEVLSRSMLDGPRFHCIKDLILHVPMVEDSWIHEDFLRDTPIWAAYPALEQAGDGPFFAEFPLVTLLDYWKAVEASTQRYLPALSASELGRMVTLGGSDGKDAAALDGLVWHVLIHEMRHTAQIGVMLRISGIKPPFLDLLNYLPITSR